MSELTSEQEQAVVAFEHAAQELRFFKSQQWSVAARIRTLRPAAALKLRGRIRAGSGPNSRKAAAAGAAHG